MRTTLIYFQQLHKIFLDKKIKISQQNINIIIERSKGNRIYLKNELEKISNYIETKNITEEEILTKSY